MFAEDMKILFDAAAALRTALEKALERVAAVSDAAAEEALAETFDVLDDIDIVARWSQRPALARVEFDGDAWTVTGPGDNLLATCEKEWVADHIANSLRGAL